MKDKNNWVWGAVLVVVGLYLGGRTLGFFHFSLFFPGWWTLFLIVPAISGIRKRGANIGSLMPLLLGCWLLARAWGGFHLGFGFLAKLFLPLALVLIGLTVFMPGLFSKRQPKEVYHDPSPDGKVNHNVTFGTQRILYPRKLFTGGRASSLLGTLELDLRSALLDGDLTLDSRSVLGKVRLMLPPGVRLKVYQTRFFGGVKNDAFPCQDPAAPTVYLNATCVLGSIEVK